MSGGQKAKPLDVRSMEGLGDSVTMKHSNFGAALIIYKAKIEVSILTVQGFKLASSTLLNSLVKNSRLKFQLCVNIPLTSAGRRWRHR